jgi:serine-type D-Ala-D-Ala carboxypeptidase (penicillin-binding protein 5/6)
MKLITSPVFTTLLACSLMQAAPPVPPPKPPTLVQVQAKLLAKAALLIDPLTGDVLYARNIDAPYPPASTVKLMTALVAYEKMGARGTVTIAPEDTRVEPSSVPLRAGEILPISDLYRSIIIGSDNDSAMALARAASGSVKQFVADMNAEAVKLGMTDSHFGNPHGLPGTSQRTTARDLMKLFNSFLSIPSFRQMAQTRVYNLRTAIGVQRMRNHNKLLGSYPGMGPAKTGWTYEARHTFAASATREGRELRLTLLKSANKWTDTRLLFDYGFANLSPAPPRKLLSSAQNEAPRNDSSTPTSSSAELLIQPEPVSYTVRRGDSLTTIARRYGVGVEDILLFNPMDDPDLLIPGQTLRIPVKPRSR